MKRWVWSVALITLTAASAYAAKAKPKPAPPPPPPPAPTLSATQDASAVLVLDRMSDIIGDLNSCGFTLKVDNDVTDQDFGLVTQCSNSQVYMVGPDKMLVDTHGWHGHRGYWYDGKTITYYSYDDNRYAVAEAPGTIMETIDAIHTEYGVDFPGADFFYPSFTDDLIKAFPVIRMIGRKTVEGQVCYQIVATNSRNRVQVWVADNAVMLPVKFSVTNLTAKGAPQYVGTFSDWQLNPALPAALFTFDPPPSAAPLRLVSKSGK